MKFHPAVNAAPEVQRRAATAFQQATLLHRQGRPFEADALCSEVLRADPRHAGAWHLRGLIALEGNQTGEGIEWIERSLQLHANQPAAHSNIGNALLARGRAREALQRFERALQLRSDYVAALYNRGNALRELSRFEEALDSYDRALDQRPNHPAAYTNRGLVLLELGRIEDGLNSLRRARELAPRSSDAAINEAAALLQLRRFDRAAAVYEAALMIAPRDVRAMNGRGLALAELGRLDEAFGCHTQAAQCDPANVDTWIYRGRVLQALERHAEALGDYQQALRLVPHSVLALNNAANVLLAVGDTQTALGYYAQALAGSPHDPLVLHNYGTALRDLRRYQEAEQMFAQLYRVAPEHEYALGNLFHLRQDCCDWSEYASLKERLQMALSAEQRMVNPLSTLLMDMPELQLQCARAFMSASFPLERYPLAPPLPAQRVAYTGSTSSQPIRIAYVSGDFREHPVAYLLVGVLEQHDRARFEPIAISLRPAEDSPLGRRVRAAFSQLVEVQGRSDRQVAELLRELHIDIAVDLMGLTQGQRPGIFAARAAPVQVGYLGYAATSGAPFIDYLIADETVIPVGAEGAYAEQVVRLPHCYLPNDDRREALTPGIDRTAAGLPEGALVLCAFSSTFKLNPPMFDAWMRILQAAPGSVLWLRACEPVAQENLRREAVRRGVTAERLIFAPHVADIGAHLARLALADLYLDTFPYNAHSTACDALWSGLPVLTCMGRSFASRVAASALRALDLTQLVTHSIEEYERQAIHLLASPPALRGLRARLQQQRACSALFDTAGYTRHLEQAFRTMHERSLRGLAPRGFDCQRDGGTR